MRIGLGCYRAHRRIDWLGSFRISREGNYQGPGEWVNNRRYDAVGADSLVG
jgi:hypothetical protein